MPFELDPSYKQVPDRLRDLKEAHPDARLRPANPDKPFDIVMIDGRTFIVYVAACYRDADDTLPAIGCAWEPFPGLTPYTKNSELQNAETSAWGRAIVAALRSESKAVASATDVRNRQSESEAAPLADIDRRREIFDRLHALDAEEGKKLAEALRAEGFPGMRTLTESQADEVERRLSLVEGGEATESTQAPQSGSEPEPARKPRRPRPEPVNPAGEVSEALRGVPQQIVDETLAEVQGMAEAQVDVLLTERVLHVNGNLNAKRMRLFQALCIERQARAS